MKKILFLIIFNNLLFSQNVEMINRLDTVYFKYSNKEKFVTKIKAINKNVNNYKIYRIKNYGILFIHEITQKDSIKAKHSRYKYVTKRFIKENNNKIINAEFFNNFKSCQENESFINSLKKRVFYVIDFSERKSGKIPMYQVNPMMQCTHKE